MEIRVELEDLSTVKKKLRVEITADTARKEVDRVANDYRRHARLPGFRPGKAPVQLVRRRFQKDIRQDVLQQLIPQSYDQAVKEKGLRPLGRPSLENVDFEEGKPIVYEARFEVGPEIQLPVYKGLEVLAEERPVTDEDVDQQIENLREKHARLLSVANQPVQQGEYAVVDLHGEALDDPEDSEPAKESRLPIVEENLLLEVGGEKTLQAFNEALVGMKVGEEKTCEVQYPAKYPTEKLAGRRVLFNVRLNEVKKKELPEVNDEFAKDVGSYETLFELRGKLKDELMASRQENRQNDLKKKLIDQLIERKDFELPDTLVEERIDDKIKDLAYNIAAQGVDPSKANVDWLKVRSQLRTEAEKEVRASVILEEIASQENLEVSNEDLESELDQLANSMNQPKEKVRQHFQQENRMETLRHRILTRKALSLVFENAKVKSS